MKKRLFSILLAFALVFSMVPAAARADQPVEPVGDWGTFGGEKIERGFFGAVAAGESVDVTITLNKDAQNDAEIEWLVTHWNGSSDDTLESGKDGISWTLSADKKTLTLTVGKDGACIDSLTLGAQLKYTDGDAEDAITPGGLLVYLNAKKVTTWEELSSYVSSCNYHEDRAGNLAVITGNISTPTNDGALKTALETFLQDVTLVVESGASLTVTKGNAVWSGVTIKDGASVTVQAGGVLATTMGGDITVQGGYDTIPSGELTVEAGTADTSPALLITWMGGRLINSGTFKLDGNYLITDYYFADTENDSATDHWSYSGEGTATVGDSGKLFAFVYGDLSEGITESVPSIGEKMNFAGVGLPVYNTDELDYWLEETRSDALRVMKNMTISQKVDTYLQLGDGLFVNPNVTLTVASGGSLTGTTIVENGANLIVNGTVQTGMGWSPIDNNGTITVNQGGTLTATMGASIINQESGKLIINGTMNISDKDDWAMLGRFENAGSVTGSGTINVANIGQSAIPSEFTGTVNYYAVEVKTLDALTTALADTLPVSILFVTDDIDLGGANADIGSRAIVVGTSDKVKKLENGTLTIRGGTYAVYFAGEDWNPAASLVLNGGSLTEWKPATVDSSSKTITLPTPTRSGHTFTGWQYMDWSVDDDEDPQKTAQAGAFTADNGFQYEFIAQWRANSSTGGTTSTDTAITVPVTGETGGVQVEATISQGTATVGDISAENVTKAVAEDSKPVSLVIDLSDTGKTVEKVVLSNDSFQNVTDAAKDEDSAVTGLTVKLSTADVEMDANTLTAVLEQAEGKDITIAVDETPVSDLNAKQKDAVETLTAPAIIDAYFLAGSKRIESLGGGKITITIPYVLTKGAAIVNYVDDEGKLEKMLCTYDAKAKTVSFETTHNSYYVVSTDDDPCVNFADINREAWYHEAIDYAIENGLMNGEGGGKFDPNGKLSRAMLCQIFYNKEGRPAVTAENPFTDVPAGQWYTDAVVWAYENEIVDGYGNGKFGPTDDITREQLAAIIWRYDGKKVSAASLDTFNDAGKISSYAVDALKWAYENGVVSGKGNGILDPLGKAQRCEVAQMLMNYLEK